MFCCSTGEPLPPVVAAGIVVEPETQVPIWDLRRKRRWVTGNKAMWNQQDFFFRSLSKYVDSIQAFEVSCGIENFFKRKHNEIQSTNYIN